jgi:hypothetical protein
MKYLDYDFTWKEHAVGDINLTIATTWLRSLRIDDWRRLTVSIAPGVASPRSNCSGWLSQNESASSNSYRLDS